MEENRLKFIGETATIPEENLIVSAVTCTLGENLFQTIFLEEIFLKLYIYIDHWVAGEHFSVLMMCGW